MEIIRSIYLNDTYHGEFKLQKNNNRFLWRRIRLHESGNNKKLYLKNRKTFKCKISSFGLTVLNVEFSPLDLEI